MSMLVLPTFDFRCAKISFLALCLFFFSPVNSAIAGNTATNYLELPPGAFPALYYWSAYATNGFGAYSSTYRYGAHPGYERRTNYRADLDSGHGFLVEHPSALATIFAETEAYAVENCCGYWQDIQAVYRTSPFKVDVWARFPAEWDADVWYRTSNSVRFVEGYGWWNFYLYSGRACPDNHDLWALKPVGYSNVEEYFCAPKQGWVNKEKNQGEMCPLPIKAGNPIHVGTGNKYQRELVYSAPGNSPLRFELHYNSLATKSIWTNTYSRSISGYFDAIAQYYDEVRTVPQAKYLALTVTRQDGRMLRFRNIFDWDLKTTVDGRWEGDADIHYQLYSVNDAMTGELVGFDIYTPQNTREHYNLKGKLQGIYYADGRSEILSYTPSGSLEAVTDNYGNTLNFSGSTLTVPGGAEYRMTFAGGKLTEIVYPDGTPGDDADNPRRQYHYNEPAYTSGAVLPKALTGITDERGVRYATWEYNSDGRAKASYHAGNAERVDIAYNDTNGTRTVTHTRTSGDGTTTYINTTYTTTNQLGMALPKNITGPACAECGSSNTSYSYDPANNNLISKTENGVTTQYGDYDSNGNYGYKSEALGTSEERRIEYTYDPRFNGKIATLTEPSVVPGLEKVTTYDYDDFGNRTLVRIDGFQPDGQGGGIPVSSTTTYQYDGPLNQLSQIDGPRTDVSDITTLNYYADDAGEGNNRARLKEIIDANGVMVRSNIQYTATGKVAAEDRSNGLHLDYAYYPGNDRLETITQTAGGKSRITRWIYLATGEVESITQGYGTADATTITFGYDDARRLEKITDGLGNYIQYTLDTDGNKEAEEIFDSSNALRKALSRTFDDYNRLDTSVQANEFMDYHFSVNGTLDTVTDGKNSVTDYDYDGLKRLVSVTQDLGGTDPSTQDALTQYGYDVQDNLTSVTDPINGNTSYVYDDLGNLLSQDSPDTGATTFTYDEAGNIETKLDAKGQSFSYSYDALNRLTLLDAPGTDDDISYGYDTCTNGTGRLCGVTYGPQSADPITVSYSYNGFGDVVAHQGVGYGYDDVGRLSSMIYPSGAVVHYEYDAAGQVNRVELDQNGQITVLASNILYHPLGPVETLTYGNGQSLSQAVDTAYRYTDLTAFTALSHTGILYDANGNLTDRTNDGTVENFGYDNLNRVETANGRFGGRSYQYDRNGNRLEKQEDGTPTAYSYEPGSNRMAGIGASSVVLDENGNTLSNGEQGYTYTVHNRLKTASDITGLLGEYRYNGLGQRIEKSVNGESLQFQYGLDGALLAETSAEGVQREYIYMNAQPLAVVDYRYIPPSPEDKVLDEYAPEVSLRGSWTERKGRRSHENGFLLAAGGSDSIARWTPVLDGGVYDLYGWWPRIKKNSSAVPFFIKHADGATTIAVDQTATGRDWILLGQFSFTGDGTEYVEITDANGAAAADSVRWVKNLEQTTPILETAVYYIHNDHLGTPQAMSDSLGNTVWKATYGPFGQTGVDEDADGDGKVVSLNLVFPGQYYDQETGLHYNLRRTYDPSTGRYLESDPIGLWGGLNTYAYVGGNPLSYSDPTGLCIEDACIIEGTLLFCARFPNLCINAARAVGAGIGVGICAISGMCNESADDAGDSEQCPPEKKGKESKPSDNGPPNGYEEGPRRGREYGPDGKPLRDYDKPHQGADYDHVHEWPNGEREHPGRPYSPIPRN